MRIKSIRLEESVIPGEYLNYLNIARHAPVNERASPRIGNKIHGEPLYILFWTWICTINVINNKYI